MLRLIRAYSGVTHPERLTIAVQRFRAREAGLAELGYPRLAAYLMGDASRLDELFATDLHEGMRLNTHPRFVAVALTMAGSSAYDVLIEGLASMNGEIAASGVRSWPDQVLGPYGPPPSGRDTAYQRVVKRRYSSYQGAMKLRKAVGLPVLLGAVFDGVLEPLFGRLPMASGATASREDLARRVLRVLGGPGAEPLPYGNHTIVVRELLAGEPGLLEQLAALVLLLDGTPDLAALFDAGGEFLRRLDGLFADHPAGYLVRPLLENFLRAGFAGGLGRAGRGPGHRVRGGHPAQPGLPADRRSVPGPDRRRCGPVRGRLRRPVRPAASRPAGRAGAVVAAAPARGAAAGRGCRAQPAGRRGAGRPARPAAASGAGAGPAALVVAGTTGRSRRRHDCAARAGSGVPRRTGVPPGGHPAGGRPDPGPRAGARGRPGPG